jgi:hypothetical protein
MLWDTSPGSSEAYETVTAYLDASNMDSKRCDLAKFNATLNTRVCD